MKPTVPVVVFSAAAAPTRKEPCSSAKVRFVTFGPLTSSGVASMMPNFTSGYFGATVLSAGAYAKPTATTGLNPDLASSSSRVARSVSVSPARADSSLTLSSERLKSFFAVSRPTAAESLNDLSPRPPMS